MFQKGPELMMRHPSLACKGFYAIATSNKDDDFISKFTSSYKDTHLLNQKGSSIVLESCHRLTKSI